jgi:hypothetical protein
MVLTGLAGASAYAQVQLKERSVNLRAFDVSKLVVVTPRASVAPLAVRRKPMVGAPPAPITAAEFARLKPQLAKALSLEDAQVPLPSAQNTITIGFASRPPGTSIWANFTDVEGCCAANDPHPDCVMVQGNAANLDNNMGVALVEGAGTYLFTCYVYTDAANIPYHLDTVGTTGVKAGIHSSAAVQGNAVMIPLRLQENADIKLTFPLDSSYAATKVLGLYSCDVMKIN